MTPVPAVVLASVTVAMSLGGCILAGDDEVPTGWRYDEEAGVAWRPLSQTEMDGWYFDDHQAAYVFRIPGLVGELGTEDEVRFDARVYGDFVEAELSLREEKTATIEGDDPRTQHTRRFDVEAPWENAFLVDGSSFSLQGSTDGWSYHVVTMRDEFELNDDVRAGDLVSRVQSPCEEWSEAGDNATAACLHRRPLDRE